jgi:hypothetical protein
MPRRVLDLLSSWGNSLGRGQVKQIWKHIPLCVMWGLWRERNARHFEDVETRCWSCVELRFIHYFYWSQLIIARIVLRLRSF